MKFNNCKNIRFSAYYQVWKKVNLENDLVRCSKTKDFKSSVVTDVFHYNYVAFSFKDHML